MKGQVVLGDVGVPLFPGDIHHGIEFDNPPPFFKDFQSRAVIRLPAHQAGDPDVVVELDGLKRLYLVYGTTIVRVRFVKFVLYTPLMLVIVTTQVLDFEVKPVDQLISIGKGLREMKTSVNEADWLIGADTCNDM
jgi:hypothetical protein